MAFLTQEHSVVLWLTGLSGAGKTTIARAVEQVLHSKDIACCVLDGDAVRSGLNKDLGFSADNRQENIRRIAEVAKLFADTGIITIVACISPTREMRAMARDIIGAARYREIYVSTPLAVCQARDVKGLYARAAHAEIASFTGITAPYEAPLSPTLTIDTSHLSVAVAAQRVLSIIPPTA